MIRAATTRRQFMSEPEIARPNATERLKGKVCVVTGASSGIGKVTSRELARQGAKVIAVVRDRQRGESALAHIREAAAGCDVSLAICDFASQRSIRRLAAELLADHPAIHVLVNNAGGVLGERRLTEDGIESTFAVNHLGYFLLTELLLERLRASAPARIVSVASEAHRRGHLDWDDLSAARRFDSFRAYGTSKLSNIAFTFELARRLEGSGVTANAVHPGVVATNFGASGGSLMRLAVKLARPFFRTEDKGADTIIWLASSPEVERVTGKYFIDRHETRASREASDPEIGRKLWEVSERLVSASTSS
jgi:NAD(P)-dependent dehydrogenase (short-subunit alcohol dehydrogenase family)